MNNFFYSDYPNIRRKDGNMQIIQKLALVLIIIGAINWGLVGLFDFNLVDTLFGVGSIISKIVYILVGISGIIDISLLFNDFE